MANETVPAERVPGGASTDGLRLGGALWVIAGAICAGLLIVVFVGENLVAQNPGSSALVLGGAVAALLTGGLLLARPGPGVVRWSTVLGLAWALAFESLMLTALNGPDRGPMLSSGLITGFGVAGALITFRAGRSARRLA
ncbi:MAG: hypothetical protein HY264_05580 [Chloroflexi bacterium]|nr:hypothetical protein [Chloroflexota bacterium]